MVFCDSGWVVIAKVVGVSPTLRYEAAAWTGDVGLAFPVADATTAEDALLESYWRVPVRELRIRMWDDAGEMRSADAMLQGSSVPTTLREAMNATVRVALDAAGWSALLGADLPAGPACDSVGIATSNARVRIGIVVGDMGSCDPALAWAGVGASSSEIAACSMSTNAAGG